MNAKALSPEILRALVPSSSSRLGLGTRALPVGLDSVLPDGGFPSGAVVELASTERLGRATSLALRACGSAQQEAKLRGGEAAWCAWIDPSGTLYAPGVAAHGLALDRLLVVRPPLDALARSAVRVVSSQVFSVVVIDTAGVPGATLSTPLARWHNVTRRLALAAAEGGTCVILLTERAFSQSAGLPVALRLNLEPKSPERLSVQVAKERRGRIGNWRDVLYGLKPAA